MKIAYLTYYLGDEFLRRYAEGKKFALSGIFKSKGIARAMMAAGHEVTIYSPGITNCDAIIPAFTEDEIYPEGTLHINYCNIVSKHKCGLINDFLISRKLRKDSHLYDVFVYYNIGLAATLSISAFKNKIRVIEYEDNVFNKALQGDKNDFVWFKTKMYNKLMANTDGVMAVCLGLQLKNVLKYSVLTPGLINEDVITNVSTHARMLKAGCPVHIILTGGIHYSKGGDLLVKAMSYIKTPCIISVYGNCDLNEMVKELLNDAPAIHKFEFKGYMEHAELIKTLDKDADILINTTRSMHVGAQAAGFPFKMMEYASTGRPIVSSEIGKLDEDFNRHITYYDGENPEVIAAAIEEVITNYDSKVQSALQLQKRVLAEYTIEGTGKKLDAFFKEIVDHES